jgi:hypothetical protein
VTACLCETTLDFTARCSVRYEPILLIRILLLHLFVNVIACPDVRRPYFLSSNSLTACEMAVA